MKTKFVDFRVSSKLAHLHYKEYLLADAYLNAYKKDTRHNWKQEIKDFARLSKEHFNAYMRYLRQADYFHSDYPLNSSICNLDFGYQTNI